MEEPGEEAGVLSPGGPGLRLTRQCSLFPPLEAGFHDEADDRASLSGGESGPEDTPLEALPAARPKGEAGAAKPGDSLAESRDRGQGVVVHAKVMTDDFSDAKFCLASGELKPRRPMPLIKASELLRNLRRVDDRWIFDGPLNGWPSLVRLELRSLTCRESTLGFRTTRRLWNASDGSEPPPASKIPKRTRATFAAPSWNQVGWSPESPGFVWWYARLSGGPQACLYGERLLDRLQDGPQASARAVTIHAFAHRYIVEHETLRDKQTWHTGIVVEWDHGLFTSLVELAWLNGCGGYAGKSNWCEDKLANPTQLYEAMPDSMKGPWNSGRAEIRVHDMPHCNKEEFEAFLQKYSERGGLPMQEQRFLEPRVYASGQVRLRWCSAVQLAGYLLNYIRRATTYETLRCNCQTFAADLFSFMAGKADAQPFGALVRPVYKQRSHAFLYMPS